MSESNHKYYFLPEDDKITPLIIHFNWASTSLGPMEKWSSLLKSNLQVLLSSPRPLVLLWGQEGICFFNQSSESWVKSLTLLTNPLGLPVLQYLWRRWPDPLKDLSKEYPDFPFGQLDKSSVRYNVNETSVLLSVDKIIPVIDHISKQAGLLLEVPFQNNTDLTLNELMVSNQRFQSLVEQATVGIIVVTGPQLMVEIVNERYGLLIGRTKEELVGKPLFSVIPEAEKDFKPLIDQVRAKGESVYLNGVPYFVFLQEQKISGYLDLVYQPYLDKDGKITGVMVLCHDVTSQVEAMRTLELEKERTRLALLGGDLGVYDLDLQTDELYTDERFTKIWGVNDKLTRGKYVDSFLEEDRDTRNKAIQELLVTGQVKYEARIRRNNDGVIRWIKVVGKTIYDDQGKPSRLYGVVSDITEEKQIREQLSSVTKELLIANERLVATNEEMATSNEELEETNKQLFKINSDLDNFIYTASHDLKAPVNNLEGLFNTLLSEIQLTPDLLGIQSMIEESFQRYKTTIHHLTEISKLHKENGEDIAVISVQQCINDVLADMQFLMNNTHTSLTMDIHLQSIRFSYKNLRSILYNLISNAVKYRSDLTPQISLFLGIQEQQILLQIKDNGIGIPKAKQEFIFGMFKRAHDHTEGSGIGLFIVKRIVENAHGKISVESEVGKGTVFSVYLPLKYIHI